MEHLDPAPDATPLPFSLAPSSSTGSEQRGKYLDRGKYLVAAAVREASSVLSICPHAKRAASVPLQCTTNELVPAGADELGAPEEESESEEEAAPPAEQAGHEAASANNPIKSIGYQHQPYQHPTLSAPGPINTPIESTPPANSSAAVCGPKTKSARGGAKPVAVSPVASGSASRRRIGPPKPAAETCWHNVRARVNTGRKVRNPPPQPRPEAGRTLKHRPRVPSPAERETAAAEREMAAALAAAALERDSLEPPPEDVQPVSNNWKLPEHAGVVERMEKSVEEGLDSLASTIAERILVDVETEDTGKDAAAMAVVAKLAGKWRRSITRALPAADTETGKVDGRTGDNAGGEAGAESAGIENFRSEARRISAAFRKINHRIAAAANDDNDSDGDSDSDTNVPFRVAYQTRSCVRRISSAPVLPTSVQVPARSPTPAAAATTALALPPPQVAADATAAAAVTPMVSNGHAPSFSAAADDDYNADAGASSPLMTNISPRSSPQRASPKSFEAYYTRVPGLGGKTGYVPSPPLLAAAPLPTATPGPQQLVARATAASAAGAKQRLDCCVVGSPADGPSSWQRLRMGRPTSDSSHAESTLLSSRGESRPSSGSARPSQPCAMRRAGGSRQVLLDRATAEARVGITSEVLPVVGHSMRRRRCAARVVGRQNAQWGRTANAALRAWPAIPQLCSRYW